MHGVNRIQVSVLDRFAFYLPVLYFLSILAIVPRSIRERGLVGCGELLL